MSFTLRRTLAPALLLIALPACDSSEPCVSDEAAAIEIAAPRTSLVVGETIDLAARATNRCGGEVRAAVEWASLADDIVSVSASGVAVATGAGEARIIATAVGTSGPVGDTLALTVDPRPPLGLVVEADRMLTYIEPGEDWDGTNADTAIVVASGFVTTLIPLAILEGGDTVPAGPVTWSSSAPDVVAVDSAGLLTARSAGRATITAVLGNLSASGVAIATTGYSAVDLGFDAVALNDLGDVVGRSSTGAVLWSEGATTPLGNWYPYAINSGRTIVGGVGYWPVDGPPVAWRDGVRDTLPSGDCGRGAAFAVNEDDVIVGDVLCGGGAVRWSGATVDTIGAGSARDINASGVIIGSRKWSNGEETLLIRPDGTPGAAVGLNDSGYAVGDVAWQISDLCRGGYGIVWDPDGSATRYEGNPYDGGYPGYGAPNLALVDVNNAQVIVGARGDCLAEEYVVVHPGQPPIPLHLISTSSPGRLRDPYGPRPGIDINESGQIAAGTALLTPIPF